MPDTTTKTQQTSYPLPRKREAVDGYVARHGLRPPIVDFINFWIDWVDRLGRLPRRSECDPIELKPWLSTVRIIRVEPGFPEHAHKPGLKYRYYYRLIGTEHRDYDDRDYTNHYLDSTNLSLDRVAYLGRTYERIISSRWPVMMNHDHFGSGHGIYECQRVLCPITDAHGDVKELFGVWSYGALIGPESEMDQVTRMDLIRSGGNPGADEEHS